LEEPLDVTEHVERTALVDVLRRFANAGTAVIVTTSLPSDVEGLVDHVHLLARGRLTSSGGGFDWPGARRRELVVWLDSAAEARRLARELGEQESLAGVAWDGRSGEPGLVWVRASRIEEAAAAVAEVVANEGLEPLGMQPVSPGLQDLNDAARSRAELVALARRGGPR
jgi:ABC-type multidrug transport system ATPase subunit